VRVVAINRLFWPNHSATSRVSTDLARHLTRQGHALTVVASRQREDEPRPRYRRVRRSTA